MKYIENDYGTFKGKSIKYMLIGNPTSFKTDVRSQFLSDSDFELIKEYKLPFGKNVYFLYNSKDDLWMVAPFSHFVRVFNNKEDAVKALEFHTDLSDLYHLV